MFRLYFICKAIGLLIFLAPRTPPRSGGYHNHQMRQMAIELDESDYHQAAVNAYDRISMNSINHEEEEINNSGDSNFDFEIDVVTSSSNNQRAISTKQFVFENKPSVSDFRAEKKNSQKKQFRLCKKFSSFFSALRLREISVANASGEIMGETASTKKNSQTENENDSANFKLKLFQIEKVECDRSIRYPHPRSGHRIVANDFYIYLFGGFNPDVQTDPFMNDDPNWAHTNPLFQELWRFCKTTRTWLLMRANVQGDPPPTELASHSAVLFGNSHILVYGGSGANFGIQSSNKLHMVDLNTSKWTLIKYNNDIEDLNIPLPMYGQAIVFDYDKMCMYVVGGTTGFEYFLDVHAFDWIDKKWTKLNETLPSDIEVRYRHELALWDNKLYVIGGGMVQSGHTLEMVPIFDLNTNTWYKLPTHPHVNSSGEFEFPAPRYSHDCAQLGSTIYMVGGTHNTTVYNDIWALDLTTLTWQRLPCSLPRGLYFHSVAITDEGQLSVFGGVSSVETKVRNNTYFEVWVKVPKLKKLSQMALFAKFGADKKKLKTKLGEYLQEIPASFESLQISF